jgi:hypothetical protein
LARRPSRLCDPKRLGVTPLADAARRLDVSCVKRRAALPLARGATPQLSERSVRWILQKDETESANFVLVSA